MFARRSFPILVFALAACGDVPHPPSRILPKLGGPDAGTSDASVEADAATDASTPPPDVPRGPLPVSAECLGCGAAPCFMIGAVCAGDAFCQSCFGDVLAPGCLENQHLLDLGRCVCTSDCYATCREVCDTTRYAWDRPTSDSGPTAD